MQRDRDSEYISDAGIKRGSKSASLSRKKDTHSKSSDYQTLRYKLAVLATFRGTKSTSW